jgi:ABC-type dipeptide/oligopeptide/nickel transport system permease component
MITRMAGDRENQKVAYINVQARDVKEMDKAQEEVARILRRAHGGVVDFQVFNRKAFMRQQEQQGKIYAQFLVESVVVTILGGLLGLGLGIGFTSAMSALIRQPVVLTPQIMALGLFFAVTVGVFFGFYPAIRAARLNPVEALRYE